MKARVIAFYLPQYHPIPENEKFWGKGFTEWTNVAKAKPLFRGHYQPHIPADLGFYDLRIPEIREQQADLARDAGIEGFCYWHYWFGNGKMLLQRPFEEVLSSGKPDFPFCLGWANHDWSTGTWLNGKNQLLKEMIAEQLYPGEKDYIAHFNYCLPAFKDHRYIKVDGKPFFYIWSPLDSDEIPIFIQVWQRLAKENGLPGIHFVAANRKVETYKDMLSMGFEGVNNMNDYLVQKRLSGGEFIRKVKTFIAWHFHIPVRIFNYKNVIENYYSFSEQEREEFCYPTVVPCYDRSPRAGGKAEIYHGSTPQLFRKHLQTALEMVKDKPFEKRIIMLKSWNEWGEGNYMEPDLKYGHAYLDALKSVIKD